MRGGSVGNRMLGCEGRECRRGIVGERVWGWESGGWSVQVELWVTECVVGMKERDCVGGSGGWSLGERVWGRVCVEV